MESEGLGIMFLVKIFVVNIIFIGGVVIALRYTFLTSTEGAVQRLSKETQEARAKQAELDQKIKAANEELDKRKKEADEVAKKLLEEAEEKAKEEREKIVKKARADGEEIISKAQGTQDKMKAAIEKQVKLETVTYAASLLNKILSEKAQGALEERLFAEFLENLEKVSVEQLGEDVNAADVVTAREINTDLKNKIQEVLKKRLNRDITVNATTDPKVISGVVLRFGSLALDASLQNLIDEASVNLREEMERS